MCVILRRRLDTRIRPDMMASMNKEQIINGRRRALRSAAILRATGGSTVKEKALVLYCKRATSQMATESSPALTQCPPIKDLSIALNSLLAGPHTPSVRHRGAARALSIVHASMSTVSR